MKRRGELAVRWEVDKGGGLWWDLWMGRKKIKLNSDTAIMRDRNGLVIGVFLSIR